MPGFSQKLELSQKLEQKQIQIQRQILKSELVQLTTLALEMRVKAELEENPLLEVIEDETENIEQSDTPASSEKTEGIPVAESAADDKEVDWDQFLNDSDHFEYRVNNRQDNIDMPQPDTLSLADHLYEQIQMDDLTRDEKAVAEEIIGNINRNGYLDVSLEEIVLMSGALYHTVKAIHKRITNYNPLGIASLDLRGCLLVQLRHRFPNEITTIRILNEFWDDFVNKRYELLSEKLHVDLDSVKHAFEIVTRLSPKPGEGYFTEKENYITTDLIVTLVDNEFEIYLSDGNMPNFRINSAYREMYLQKKNPDKVVKEFLTSKLEKARWFIAAVHQRRTTMLRTMRAILDRQREFFVNGPSHLKPMILEHIAEDIEMDVSTISRVTRDKYVQTDWGVFELKYFFSEKMVTESGENVSNRIIKQRLQELIGNENKMKPLSDQALTVKLEEEGFMISRRTVAKYREQLRIPVQRLRREI